MELSIVSDLYESPFFPLGPSPKLKMIAIAEDDLYSSFEYDIVGPKARKYLRKELLDLGFSSKGSREFIHRDTNLKIRFPKPQGVLGAHPCDLIRSELDQADAWIVVTPTECILTLFAVDNDKSRVTKDELLEFVFKFPSPLYNDQLLLLSTWNFKCVGTSTSHFVVFRPSDLLYFT